MFCPLHKHLSDSKHFLQLPSKKEEKWQFSKLSRYLDKEYQDHIQPQHANTYKHTENFVHLQDGKLVDKALPVSVNVNKHPLFCEVTYNPFAKLASSLAPYPLELNIFEDLELSIYLDYSKDSFLNSHLNIILQEGIKAKIYIVFKGGDKSFISHSSHIKLEKKSELILTQVQDLSSQAVLISQDCLHLHEQACMEKFSLLFNGEYLHHFIRADLHHKSQLDMTGLLLSEKEKNFIYTCDINHLADKSTSHLLSKQVLKDKSSCVFDANTKIFENTRACEATQGSHALLLDEQAQIHAKPHLEIYADDLVASHGSTVGAIDEDATAYLISRGISPAKAKSILIRAFVQETLENITWSAHKQKVLEILGEAYE